ncbi:MULTISPECIES: transposase [Burkholderia cepacia complex]|uniref:transposase n=1 Tax=Burkholderia cepacia complex TaxID=87882 RepID=UPI0021F48732|nr:MULTISPECIES: transposase [Burkholderia cepacia complex]
MKKKRRTVASQAAALEPLPELPKELLEQLVNEPMTPAEVQDLMLAFNKAVIERGMGAEINLRLGYPPGQPKLLGQVDERNGANGKRVITDRVPVRAEVPRDRDGSFEPIVIPKHDRGGLDVAKCIDHAQAECLGNPDRLHPHRHFLYRSRRI